MNAKEIGRLLARLDGTGSDDEWAAVSKLRTIGAELPNWLLKRFRVSRGWKARTSCVFHAIRYARKSEDALALGLEAIVDRSKIVRYRGAMLLAYSQRKDALPYLRAALVRDGPGADDLLAAIDAIENENHNYFVDREHSGKMKWEV